MIDFYNDQLVPPELCRLLYQAVPKQYHVPVRFYNRRQKDLYGERGSYPLGSLYSKAGILPWYIEINLNPIFESCGYMRPHASAPSTNVWRLLLDVCLHEFGHGATKDICLQMNRHEYHAEFGHGRV